jgi:hypothetical protein
LAACGGGGRCGRVADAAAGAAPSLARWVGICRSDRVVWCGPGCVSLGFPSGSAGRLTTRSRCPETPWVRYCKIF